MLTDEEVKRSQTLYQHTGTLRDVVIDLAAVAEEAMVKHVRHVFEQFPSFCRDVIADVIDYRSSEFYPSQQEIDENSDMSLTWIDIASQYMSELTFFHWSTGDLYLEG